jgi:hypothetical protein
MTDTNALDDSTFSEILDSLLLDMTLFSNLGYRICNLYSDKIEDYFMRVDLRTFKISMSVETITRIQNCISEHQKIIILPIRLDFLNISTNYNFNLINQDYPEPEQDKLYAAHSNLLIIDTQWNTVEFFEPHGEILSHSYSDFIDLQNIIKNFVVSTFGLQDYYFVNVANTCPIGVQRKQNIVNPESGHCLVWSLYFIMIRLININFIPMNKSVSQIINEFISNDTPENLDRTIRQFFTYIESVSIMPLRFLKHNNEYDITNYLGNTQLVEERLRTLIKIYFLNATFYKRDFKKIFEEIISYKNLPNFDEIFIQELSYNYNNINRLII